MYLTKKIVYRRGAFTLVELLVVIAIILAIAALAAAFAPRVSDSQNLSRAIDNLEQWLLTAKMRAKRDGLATGVRFIQTTGDVAGTYSQLQYIQQPDALSGGMCVTSSTPGAYQYPPGSGIFYTGGLCTGAVNGTVSFAGVDFSLGGAALVQTLVQTGDYLEVRDGGVYYIASASANTLTLGGTPTYANSLSIAAPTTNYRILRQPRILIGEEPLALPNNFVVVTPYSGQTIQPGTINLGPEILFSPTGAVVGTNAGSGQLYMYVQDVTQSDPNMAGIVAVQCRTGFIGAYNSIASAQSGQESGL